MLAGAEIPTLFSFFRDTTLFNDVSKLILLESTNVARCVVGERLGMCV